MKLAILYTIWTGDDMDMLIRSMTQHEPFVDEIFVCYQRISNRGERGHLTIYSKSTPRFTAIHFEPDLSVNTKQNERMKHNLMIQTAKSKGFTHFIMAACDHFYTPEQFQYAKNYHLSNDIDVSLTFMRTYYKFNNWYIEPMEGYCMPFIHKMYPNTEITKRANYPEIVDPSVKVNTSEKIHVFPPDEVLLHHYSMVRKDIQKKFRNAAASIRWTEEQIEKFISEYENAKIGDQISYFKNSILTESK